MCKRQPKCTCSHARAAVAAADASLAEAEARVEAAEARVVTTKASAEKAVEAILSVQNGMSQPGTSQDIVEAAFEATQAWIEAMEQSMEAKQAQIEVQQEVGSGSAILRMALNHSY